jgi:hypothetical protein
MTEVIRAIEIAHLTVSHRADRPARIPVADELGVHNRKVETVDAEIEDETVDTQTAGVAV